MKTQSRKQNIQFTLLLLTLFLSISSVKQIYAAGVDLDNSFGGNGRISKFIGPVSNFPFSSAIDASGRIVTAGSAMDGSRDTASIIRYNPDGSVDKTFGIRSEQIFGEQVQFYTDVLIQSDGKILVSGNLIFNNENWQFLVRYESNGNRDFAFNVRLAPRPVGGDYSIGKIELQDDGKIILASGLDPISGRSDLFLTRFNSSGTLDKSFGTSGSVVTSTDVNHDDRVIDVKLQSDGKIIVYAYVFSGVSGSRRLGFFRYNNDGTLDTTFGTNGVAIDDYGLFALLPRGEMGIQSDDKIIFSSYAKTESTGEYKFLVVRYNADGTLDATFDTDGVVTTQIQQSSFAVGMKIQADGKILVGGRSSDGTTLQATVARYNSDGSLDTTFDTDGIVMKLTENSNGITNIVEKADGKLITVGTSRLTSTNRNSFLLLGLNSDGSSDTSFFDGGVSINPVGSKQNFAREVIVQPDGKILTIGSTTGGQSINSIGLTRVNADGTPDTSFADDGEFFLSSGAGDDDSFYDATSGALQSDGKIITAGRVRRKGIIRMAVTRINSDGSADETFGTVGVLEADITISNTNPNIRTVRLQDDGKIVVLGWFNSTGDSGNFDNDIFLARLNPDGSFDNSFDSDGIAAFANPAGNDFALAMKIQTDGKIAVLGNVNDNDNATVDRTLLRFNSDGTLDTSVNLETAFGISESHSYSSIVCTSSGKYIFGGGITTKNNPPGESLIAQMNSDGTADTNFGNNGFVTLPASQFSNSINDLQIQSDGKIIAAAQAFYGTFPSGKTDIFLARFNSNGSLDNTFNGNGVKDTGITLDNGFMEHMELQANGSIVLSGFNRPGGHSASNIELFVARFAVTQPASTKFDYDGDARADISVYRPSEGNWYLNSSTAGFSVLKFGISTDTITPADFDGDGKTDLAVYRESQNRFYILQSSDGIVRQDTFGIAGDDPTLVGDWDGDGKADVAVYREGTQGSFFYRGSNNNPNGNTTYLPWGITGDKPVRGDFDGDGKLDAVTFRPSNGVWYIRQSSDNQIRYENWGLATDVLTPADYDGDGKTDLAIYRDGVWYIRQSSDNSVSIITFGLEGDIPVPADYDGDGEDDIAVYRDGVWYILQSTNGNVSYVDFGLTSDTPTPIAAQ